MVGLGVGGLPKMVMIIGRLREGGGGAVTSNVPIGRAIGAARIVMILACGAAQGPTIGVPGILATGGRIVRMHRTPGIIGVMADLRGLRLHGGQTLTLDEPGEFRQRVGIGVCIWLRTPKAGLEIVEVHRRARRNSRSTHDPPRVAFARSTRPGDAGSVSTH